MQEIFGACFIAGVHCMDICLGPGFFGDHLPADERKFPVNALDVRLYQV